MRYIKRYENIKEKPKVGDYVICRIDCNEYSHMILLTNFCDYNIGQITEINPHSDSEEDLVYDVFYENFPNKLKDRYTNPFGFFIEDIHFYSENKEDCENYLEAEKYNL